MSPLAADILDFWYGPPPHAARDAWFRKDAAFDAAIRARFGMALETAVDAKEGGGYADWPAEPRGALALILLLDQFTRNVFRDTPRAFAGDARALATAVAVVEAGLDCGLDHPLDGYERWFLYLPFEHSEDEAMQQRSLALFARLKDDTGLAAPLEWAAKHAAVVRRFGRYPHRNAILGRASTPEELAFLAEPGSRF
jgi:uncharacterized protein (DUF924 family)